MSDSIIPAAWVQTLEAITPGFLDFIAREGVPGETWVQTASRIVSGVVMTAYQRQILDVQLERARNGLPPAGVEGTTIPGTTSTGVPSWVVLGAAALVAWVVVRRFDRK